MCEGEEEKALSVFADQNSPRKRQNCARELICFVSTDELKNYPGVSST